MPNVNLNVGGVIGGVLGALAAFAMPLGTGIVAILAIVGGALAGNYLWARIVRKPE